jgi:hypothetical protein
MAMINYYRSLAGIARREARLGRPKEYIKKKKRNNI